MFILEFPLDPVAKGRPRFSRKSGVAYTPEKTRAAEAELRWMMNKQWNRPILECALVVDVAFFFRRPKSVKRLHPTVKPDLSNIFKTVEDAGNGILWRDDSQIISASISKYYAGESKIVLQIVKAHYEQPPAKKASLLDRGKNESN